MQERVQDQGREKILPCLVLPCVHTFTNTHHTHKHYFHVTQEFAFWGHTYIAPSGTVRFISDKIGLAFRPRP